MFGASTESVRRQRRESKNRPTIRVPTLCELHLSILAALGAATEEGVILSVCACVGMGRARTGSSGLVILFRSLSFRCAHDACDLAPANDMCAPAALGEEPAQLHSGSLARCQTRCQTRFAFWRVDCSGNADARSCLEWLKQVAAIGLNRQFQNARSLRRGILWRDWPPSTYT